MRALLLVTLLLPAGFVNGEDRKPTGSEQILPSGAKLETLWEEGEFTEGVAAAPNGEMYFSDIAFGDGKGRILKYSPATGKTTVHCADSLQSNGLMFDKSGKLLAACGANRGARALCEITPDGQLKVLVDQFQGKKLNAPNDLVIHPDGQIYFSDPRYVGDESVELNHMSVYLYRPGSGELVRVTDSIEKPNGVILSPDGKTLYVAETNNGALDVRKAPPDQKPGRMTLNAFTVRADGLLIGKRVLVDFGAGPGVDGMTIDKMGNIYAAVRTDEDYGIRVYSPEGKELARIPTAELPTNCEFGKGQEATTLYITAGKGLYRIALKVPGYHPAGNAQPAAE